MRYLLLILFIVLVIFATRALRQSGKRDDVAAPDEPPRDKHTETIMLACAQCGLHLPRNEALPGRGGVYCSEAHRALAEARDGEH